MGCHSESALAKMITLRPLNYDPPLQSTMGRRRSGSVSLRWRGKLGEYYHSLRSRSLIPNANMKLSQMRDSLTVNSSRKVDSTERRRDSRREVLLSDIFHLGCLHHLLPYKENQWQIRQQFWVGTRRTLSFPPSRGRSHTPVDSAHHNPLCPSAWTKTCSSRSHLHLPNLFNNKLDWLDASELWLRTKLRSLLNWSPITKFEYLKEWHQETTGLNSGFRIPRSI